MANEAQIRTTLQVNKGNIEYRSSPTAFNADVTGSDGPTPGAITCAVAPGTSINLTQLTTPGLCAIHNIDVTNYVTVGIWDPETNIFYPFMELKAGEIYVFRLSRNIEEEFGTGTGTVGPNTNRLRVVADIAACVVVVEAFES